MVEEPVVEKPAVEKPKPVIEKPIDTSLKKGDFIELDYVGKLAENGDIFDATNPEKAKEAGIGDAKGPIIIPIGSNKVVMGIDDILPSKKVGDSFELKIPPEKGFGKKNAKLLHLIATSKFKKEQIVPQPGMVVTVDGMQGIIKTVSGGRTIVDFNHPLASKELIYKIKIVSKVTDLSKKIESVLKYHLPPDYFKTELLEKNLNVKITHDLPPDIQKVVIDDVKKCIPELKEVKFTVEKKEAKA